MTQHRTGYEPARVLVKGKDGVTRTMKASKRSIYSTRKGASPQQPRGRDGKTHRGKGYGYQGAEGSDYTLGTACDIS